MIVLSIGARPLVCGCVCRCNGAAVLFVTYRAHRAIHTVSLAVAICFVKSRSASVETLVIVLSVGARPLARRSVSGGKCAVCFTAGSAERLILTGSSSARALGLVELYVTAVDTGVIVLSVRRGPIVRRSMRLGELAVLVVTGRAKRLVNTGSRAAGAISLVKLHTASVCAGMEVSSVFTAPYGCRIVIFGIFLAVFLTALVADCEGGTGCGATGMAAFLVGNVSGVVRRIVRRSIGNVAIVCGIFLIVGITAAGREAKHSDTNNE